LKKILQKIINWELWPFYLVYTPLVFVWVYYFFKAKRFWFFAPVNPSLEFSGFEGETKEEMFNQLNKNIYPNTIYVKPAMQFDSVLLQMQHVGLTYPIAVKPNIGTKGLCFRKIDNEEQLKKYHQSLPVEYVLQDMIEWPLELSVFYVRYPNKLKGSITGLIAKEYLHVVGDGQSTLLELMEKHPKAKLRLGELVKKHESQLQQIILAKKVFYLSIAGNHNRGARFINLHKEIDDNLVNVFDDISNHTKKFYYGRYDVKTTSLEDLKHGKNISILEFNGVGAEPNHIYDCNMSYLQALKVIAKHWGHMYKIGKLNNENGIPYISFIKGWKHLRKAKAFYQRLEQYDLYC